ncbi:hypothetical protein LQ327_06170 [Actinomycetospora endophytica]|uniref:YGGT family protein n=1 Tax=Actinomycetospora endophytica TaxID=2291215 RepID=A0ABS8P4L3_9PSEU|nr:hypothetical protein [Actinomycetospora endophytica]MCD2192973.1 hypothetical protein [Actinomycetospora endophytica]
MTDLGDRPGSRSIGQRAGGVIRGVLGLLGGLVRLVTGLFAAVLIVHIVLVVLGANPDNTVARVITELADSLTLGLQNLFLLGNPTLQVVVSYGLPALVWLAVGAVIVGLLRLLGRPRSGLA